MIINDLKIKQAAKKLKNNMSLLQTILFNGKETEDINNQ